MGARRGNPRQRESPALGQVARITAKYPIPWTLPKKLPTRFYPREAGSTKTDHARKSGSIESLRAALNVFADPRFHGCGHYAHSEELADAESHSSATVAGRSVPRFIRLPLENTDSVSGSRHQSGCGSEQCDARRPNYRRVDARFYPRGAGSTKTDHARKSGSIESLRAALNVFADPRFHGCGHYTHSEELADAESHTARRSHVA